MKRICALVVSLFFLSFCPLHNQTVEANEIPIIDAHSQVDHQTKLENIIKLMDSAGVSKTIISGRAKITPNKIVSFAKKNPSRIIPAVRTKLAGYTENSNKYFASLKSQLKTGDYSAMAEILLWHASKGGKAPQIVVKPDDRRVEAALKASIENNWPFIVHIEFGSTGKKYQGFMEKFEEMLSKNANHPFVLMHMGQLNTDEVTRLIEKHSNVYFITSHANPIYLSGSNGKNADYPWVNMFDSKADGYELKEEWKNIIVQYPDKFILGLDIVIASQWGDFYLDQVKLWRQELSKLPEDVAHKLAHRNAEQLWAIEPVD